MRKIVLLLSSILCSSLASAQWATSGNNINNTNPGNVGIGTSTPEASLHVNGSTPILSTGPGAGLRFRDLKAGATINDDWHMFSRNGYLIFRIGNEPHPTNPGFLGFGLPGVRMALTPDGTLQLVKGLQTQGFYYGQGDIKLYPLEGETVSGTAYIKGVGYVAGTNVDLQFSTQANSQKVDVMRLTTSGNVGIGTTNPGTYKLAVEGKIGAREIEVKTGSWADFVFKPGYQLPSLSSVEHYIRQYNHLPNIPSEGEVKTNGIALGEMNARLLQKIEELTLYSISQQKQIMILQQEMASLKKRASAKRKR